MSERNVILEEGYASFIKIPKSLFLKGFVKNDNMIISTYYQVAMSKGMDGKLSINSHIRLPEMGMIRNRYNINKFKNGIKLLYDNRYIGDEIGIVSKNEVISLSYSGLAKIDKNYFKLSVYEYDEIVNSGYPLKVALGMLNQYCIYKMFQSNNNDNWKYTKGTASVGYDKIKELTNHSKSSVAKYNSILSDELVLLEIGNVGLYANINGDIKTFNNIYSPISQSGIACIESARRDIQISLEKINKWMVGAGYNFKCHIKNSDIRSLNGKISYYGNKIKNNIATDDDVDELEKAMIDKQIMKGGTIDDDICDIDGFENV